jgi:hypothetical protein
MREWRGVKLSIKIVCSAVEGQRIDRLRQLDGLEIVGGNWEETLGPLRAFPSLRNGGKGELHGWTEELHLVLAYAFI